MLTKDQYAHAESIGDENPTLLKIPQVRTTRVLVGVPVRKPPVVLNALFQTIAWQRLRDNVEIDILLIDNFAPGDQFAEESRGEMVGFANSLGRVKIVKIDNPGSDYGDGTVTRQWTKPAFERMAAIKNHIINYSLEHNYDYLWLLDADVLCEPYALQSFLDTGDHERWLATSGHFNPPIVAGVYWTDWQWPTPDSTDVVHAGPQVWLRHPYKLSDAQWTEADFRQALLDRRRIAVRGLGACTLIPRYAMAKGVNFNFVDGLLPGPMAEGEDRHFCARASALHVPMIADAWPNIYHSYHANEYPEIPERLEALERSQKPTPNSFDHVSAKVELLEPVPDQFGRMKRVSAQWLRGKFGALPVALPQIEEELGTMQVGTSKIIRLHYPAHYRVAQLRNQSRVARLTLFDVRDFSLPPTIDREIFVGGRSKKMIDMTTMTSSQIDEIVQ